MRVLRTKVAAAAPWLVTAAVVGIGMAAGFAHTHAAAVRAGQTGWLAWADAVVIELMTLVAGWQVFLAHRAGRSAVFPGTVMVVAFVIQMGAQVSGAPATFAGWLFAAIPALGALVLVKLVMHGRAAETPVDDRVDPVRVDAVREAHRAEPASPPAPELVAAVPDRPVLAQWPPQV